MFLETEKRPVGEQSREKHTLDEPHRLLLAAADLIEKHGWCQNELRSWGGRLCINGALLAAAGRPDAEFLTGEPLRAAKMLRPHIGHVPSWQWNDSPLRTKEEVIAKLRAVALGG